MGNDEHQYADPAHRYRLDSRIAVGGMGVVWRGTDTRLDRSVAVKILKVEYADDPTFRTRFEGEARSAAALHHPGIAGVYDYGTGGDHQPPYLVMELVDGQPLSALLSQAKASGRTLDAAVVQDLIAQAGEALGVAHRAGIVHRDVKPANLLVTPDRTVKITDFGIARAADSVALTRTGSVMGTPQYLSPEQARGNPSTPASDVYSLGVVAFECLTGRQPFEADTPVATALAHLQQPVPELPDSVPTPLAAVVRRALAKDPTERYPDGAAFAAAFRDPSSAGTATPAEGATQVLPATPAAPMPVPVPTPAPSEPMRRLETPTAYDGDAPRRGRSPWPLAVAVIVLLVLAAVLVVALINRSGEEEPLVEDTPSQTQSSETTPTEPTSEETTEETTTAPATVQVDDTSYRCNVDYNDAVADLKAMGLQVSYEQETTPNDGSCEADTVSRFSRNGTLNEGDAIVVYYWGPAEPTTPTEPTDTTSPGDGTSSDSDSGLLGDDGGEG